jgi:hypothetical protein
MQRGVSEQFYFMVYHFSELLYLFYRYILNVIL